MSGINVPTWYGQAYSTNLELLLQQMGSKLSGAVDMAPYSGVKAAAAVNQMAAIEADEVATRFEPIGRTDPGTDRRWVTPKNYDVNQLFDTFDQMQVITDPKSKAVQNSTLALGRKKDTVILNAFYAAAFTGETLSGTTAYTSGNTIDEDIGGTSSRINVAKLLAVLELMESNHVDFDREEVYIAIPAKDHSALLNDPKIISRDYTDQLVLKDGKVQSFLGFRFIQCELVESVLAGTNVVTLPVWVKSGMHLGQWNDIQTVISQRNDLRGHPWQAYAYMSLGCTRTQENKVYGIESYRA
jgi:Phage capsid protein